MTRFALDDGVRRFSGAGVAKSESQNIAIVLVHGVGDTKPTKTVDAFLSTAHVTDPLINPSDEVGMRWLSDEAHSTAKRQHRAFFPVALRYASRKGDKSPNLNFVIAEVYWGDLSAIKDGRLNLCLGLIELVFTLRFVAYWAPASGDRSSKAMRFCVYVANWILCVLIAGAATHACVLVATLLWSSSMKDVVKFTKPPQSFWSGVGAVLSIVSGLVLLIMHQRRIPSRAWGWYYGFLLICGFIGVILVGSGISDTQELIRLAIETFQRLFIFFGVFAFLALLCACRLWRANPKLREAAEAGVACLYLQIAMSTIFLVLGVLIAIAGFVSPDDRSKLLPLNELWMPFALEVGFALVFFVIYFGLYLYRGWWFIQNCESAEKDYKEVLKAPRLIVNRGAIYVLIGFSLVVSCLCLGITWPEWFPWIPFARLLKENDVWAFCIVALSAPCGTIIVALFSRELSGVLHVLLDIVNYFYHTNESIVSVVESDGMNSKGPRTNSVALKYEIRTRVQNRFKKASGLLLSLKESYDSVIVIAHSQGTIIAIDALRTCLECDSGEDKKIADHLTGRKLRLVTLGSPFTNLYQHYFPTQYPYLDREHWRKLIDLLAPVTSEIDERSRPWLNIYRIDDYVGTAIDHARIRNNGMPRGGHLNYWTDPDVVAKIIESLKHWADQSIVEHVHVDSEITDLDALVK